MERQPDNRLGRRNAHSPQSLVRRSVALILAAATLLTAGCRYSATEPTGAPSTASQPEGAPSTTPDGSVVTPTQVAAPDPRHPFPRRIEAPEFPADLTWLNTSGRVRLADLRGKFVLLDFWTYCCINCQHILPELKKLEEKYPNELVVIGVHSAKFETEKDAESIAEAIVRYEIVHPVINDSEHVIWNTYGVSSWPTLALIDPEGNFVGMNAGEIRFEQLDTVIKEALPYYRAKGLIDKRPIHFDLIAPRRKPTPLLFPGKVLADEKSGVLFVADTGHNRIIVTDLEGNLLETIGTGAIGKGDGAFDRATFNQPQGMALSGQMLYVADTRNHSLRRVDLARKRVNTIAGTGEQAKSPWPGLEDLGAFDPLPERWVGRPLRTALASPWALWVHDDVIYIAMAGTHQIWSMPVDGRTIGPYAGNGREDIVDGPLLPRRPFAPGFASFAQPSGLASDGTWLFVADSEGSSIRAVPFDATKEAITVVGTAHLATGRLFEFGDVDGAAGRARMQHPLGVVHVDGKLYVADTYNHKIKVVDARSGVTRTFAGTGKPGSSDKEGTFFEPAGLSAAGGKLYVADTNNHLIRTIDLATREVNTLDIAGLTAPRPSRDSLKAAFRGAQKVRVEAARLKPVDGKVQLHVQLAFPKGWKVNELAPMAYLLDAAGDRGPADRNAMGQMVRVEEPAAEFVVAVPVSGAGSETLELSLNYYYCESSGEGLCRMGSVVWTVPVTVAADATESTLPLFLEIPE